MYFILRGLPASAWMPARGKIRDGRKCEIHSHKQ